MGKKPLPAAISQPTGELPQDERDRPIKSNVIEGAFLGNFKVNVTYKDLFGQQNYFAMLKDRQIKTNFIVRTSLYTSKIFGSKYITLLAFITIFLSIVLGYVGRCSQDVTSPLSYIFPSWGCASSITQETRELRTKEVSISKKHAPLIQPLEIKNLELDKNKSLYVVLVSEQEDNSQKKTPETSYIMIDDKKRDRYSIDISQSVLIIGAFLLGFAQWHVGNRQGSTSEIFQRKKDINLFIIEHESDLANLVLGATDREDFVPPTPAGGGAIEIGEVEIDISRFVDTLNKIQSRGYISAEQEESFIRKMFVFLELDNLELACEKYWSGHLDADQMYRACEIFESRCLNPTFRYLAVIQGLSYYNRKFHTVLAAIVVRGYVLTERTP